MKRRATFASMLLIASAIGACMTAKQKREEQQELQRTISRTSDPTAVQDCAFIMALKPEERYGTLEAQTAALVIPKADVEWVILQTGGGNQLYSCRRSPIEAERAPRSSTSAPAAAPSSAAAPAASDPSASSSAPAPPASTAAPVAAAPPPAAPTAAPVPFGTAAAPEARGGPVVRVTNNPEAVRGCRFLANFTEFQAVPRFQEAVSRSGGDVAYVVASNKDGEVIGEAYRCAAP